MNEEFVTFKIAKKLKEKGFREKVNAYYGKNENIFDVHPALDMNNCEYRCSAPTISQVLKWLREDRNVYVCVDLYEYDKFAYLAYTITPHELIDSVSGYDTYEQAALTGIEYVLDNLI